MSNDKKDSIIAALREALELILKKHTDVHNHNRYPSSTSICKEALSTDAGKDYHNPADVEALKKAKEALKYCRISACRPAQGVAEVALAAIDKALGGEQE